MNKATKQNKEADLAGRWVRRDCLNEVMSASPGEILFDASAQSPPSHKTVEMLHIYYSRINGADFWTVVDLFDRVMRSRSKVYWNGLQEGDLKASLCGFGGVKCKYVCFFAWILEKWSWFWAALKIDGAILSYLVSYYYTVRSDDVKVLKSRWNFVKTKTTTPGNNIYTLLITFIAITSFISSKFLTLFFPYKLSYYATGGPYYAWATCTKYTRQLNK